MSDNTVNPSFITQAAGWVGRAYDAVTGSKKRKSKPLDLRSEDRLFLPQDRDKLVSNARNLRRNSAIAAYAIRKSLDYVSTFNFQCRTGIAEFDRRVEELMDWWSRPLNCDVSGRFSLQRLIRMAEGLATVEGDVFVYKISNPAVKGDAKIQIIEGDRVRKPTDLEAFKKENPNVAVDAEQYQFGIAVDDSGKAQSYAICDRTGGPSTFTLREIADAQHVFHHGYFDRYDQIRGISPLASALNTFSDLYEAQEYALAKMKLSQLFALKVKRETMPEPEAGTDADGEYEFAFGEGPQILDMVGGDDADFLESKTPSVEFQAFMNYGIQVALKSLDIPQSFFDESHTNYSGARQALLQYEQSCEAKLANLRTLLNNLTVWRLAIFIADGDLVLPDGIKTIDDITFEWISAGIPWIDPLKEVTADVMAVDNRLRSRQQIAKEAGYDWYTTVDQIAAEEKHLIELGLPVTLGTTPQLAAQIAAGLTADSPEDQGTQKASAKKDAA